jgi:hypothetical protein
MLKPFLEKQNRRGLQSLWNMEFQKRGVVHFHVWFDRELVDFEQKAIARDWLHYSGQERDEKALKVHLHEKFYTAWTVDLKANYAAKYACKSEQKALPKGIENFGRFWGIRIHTGLEQVVFQFTSEKTFRQAVRGIKNYEKRTKGNTVFRAVGKNFPTNGVIENIKVVDVFDKTDTENFQAVLNDNFDDDRRYICAKVGKFFPRFTNNILGSRLASRRYMSIERVRDIQRIVENVIKNSRSAPVVAPLLLSAY